MLSKKIFAERHQFRTNQLFISSRSEEICSLRLTELQLGPPETRRPKQRLPERMKFTDEVVVGRPVQPVRVRSRLRGREDVDDKGEVNACLWDNVGERNAWVMPRLL